ncbi:MAG TPA: TIGR02265 family protein [Polyangiaceae bacterium]
MVATDSPSRPRPLERAIEVVAPHCDIVERLQVVPPSARVRGLYLRSLETVTQRAGRGALYRQYFGGERWSPVRMYPLRDYMIRLALAGASLRSPGRVHDGMHDIWRTNATTFAGSLLGRTLLRILSNDPVRLTEQGLAARRQTYQYGHWEIVHHGPRTIEMVYREEYLWIQSAIAGGAVGAFEACGIAAQLDTKLVNRFDGSTTITW